MTVTPEQARAAAEVLRAFSKHRSPEFGRSDLCWSPSELEEWADRLEREQAAEAKREKRVEELARECFRLRYESQAYIPEWSWDSPCTNRHEWLRFARDLLDRYPSLLDEKGNEQ